MAGRSRHRSHEFFALAAKPLAAQGADRARHRRLVEVVEWPLGWLFVGELEHLGGQLGDRQGASFGDDDGPFDQKRQVCENEKPNWPGVFTR